MARHCRQPGAPNIVMAAGGTQLKKIFEDEGIYFWKVHVDWTMPRIRKRMDRRKSPWLRIIIYATAS